MEILGPLRRCGQLFLLLTLLTPVFSETSSAAYDIPLNPSEDYEDLDNDSNSATHAPRNDTILNPCYDLCYDLPAPCAELAKKQHCSCPGVSLGPSALPEEPVVRVWPAGEKVDVRWCVAHTDSSTVYRVLVQGKQVGQFDDLKRSMVGLAGVSAGAEVCVQAVNGLGQRQACEVYEPPKGSPSLALKVGLIGGALGLLLLISVAALLWRHNSRKKGGARVNTDGPL